jgi:hypothetical protein
VILGADLAGAKPDEKLRECGFGGRVVLIETELGRSLTGRRLTKEVPP